jgi:hypothetical protein
VENKTCPILKARQKGLHLYMYVYTNSKSKPNHRGTLQLSARKFQLYKTYSSSFVRCKFRPSFLGRKVKIYHVFSRLSPIKLLSMYILCAYVCRYKVWP